MKNDKHNDMKMPGISGGRSEHDGDIFITDGGDI